MQRRNQVQTRAVPSLGGVLVWLVLGLSACVGEDATNNNGWSFDNDVEFPRTCSQEPLVNTFILAGSSPQRYTSNVPSITGGRIYFHQPVDGTLQLFAQPIGSGTNWQMSDRDSGVSLEIAASGHVVTQKLPSVRNELQLRDVNGDVLHRIVEIGAYGVERARPSGGALSSVDGKNLLTTGLFLGLFSTDGELLFNGTDRSTKPTHRAVLTKDGFLYTAGHDERDPEKPGEVGPGDVFEWTPETGSQRLIDTPEDERHVWVDGRDLYWVTDEAVHKMTREGQIERIHEGRCGPVHSLGGTAVFGCSAQSSERQIFADVDEQLHEDLGGEPVATQLFLYDGRRTR